MNDDSQPGKQQHKRALKEIILNNETVKELRVNSIGRITFDFLCVLLCKPSSERRAIIMNTLSASSVSFTRPSLIEYRKKKDYRRRIVK